MDIEPEESKLAFLELDRRKHNNFRDWAVLVTLVINLAGLVWTAAKWSAAIDQLQVTSAKTNVILDAVVTKLAVLDTRATVLEYQVNKNSKALEK